MSSNSLWVNNSLSCFVISHNNNSTELFILASLASSLFKSSLLKINPHHF